MVQKVSYNCIIQAYDHQLLYTCSSEERRGL